MEETRKYLDQRTKGDWENWDGERKGGEDEVTG